MNHLDLDILRLTEFISLFLNRQPFVMGYFSGVNTFCSKFVSVGDLKTRTGIQRLEINIY